MARQATIETEQSQPHSGRIKNHVPAQEAAGNPSPAPAPSRPLGAVEDRLRRFLQAYWLRPENAFWMTLRSAALSQCTIATPSVDLSCGDGIFAFLHGGGVFDPSFDVFASVDHLDRVRDEHVDMFDCAADTYRPTILTPPEVRFDVGTDIKRSQLDKAERLATYSRLLQHDNNTPLPLNDDEFETVYCNAAYWVENIDGFLAELARVTRPGGTIVLHVKLDSMRGYTLASHRDALGDRFLDIIGRGRMATWPSLAGRDEWESRFRKAQLTVEDTKPFVTKDHAHIWDIGLRPIAPLLIRMTDALTPETRNEIKREWVELFFDLLRPICDPEFNLTGGDAEPAELQYLLTPMKT